MIFIILLLILIPFAGGLFAWILDWGAGFPDERARRRQDRER